MCYAPKLVAWALALVYKGIASPAPVNFAALKTFKNGKKNETIYLLSDTGVTSVWTAQTIFPSQHFGRIFARRTRGTSPNQGFREYRFVTAGKPKALHFRLFWFIYSISIYINLCPSTSIWIYPYLVSLCIYLCIYIMYSISACISLRISLCIFFVYLCIFDAYHLYVDLYVYIYIYIYLFIFMYIWCISVSWCISLCTSWCIYIYASLYTFISILNVYFCTSMYIDLHLSISIPDYLSLSVLYLYLSMSIYVNL